jgi:hypothetical protein
MWALAQVERKYFRKEGGLLFFGCTLYATEITADEG